MNGLAHTEGRDYVLHLDHTYWIGVTLQVGIEP